MMEEVDAGYFIITSRSSGAAGVVKEQPTDDDEVFARSPYHQQTPSHHRALPGTCSTPKSGFHQDFNG